MITARKNTMMHYFSLDQMFLDTLKYLYLNKPIGKVNTKEFALSLFETFFLCQSLCTFFLDRLLCLVLSLFFQVSVMLAFKIGRTHILGVMNILAKME